MGKRVNYLAGAPLPIFRLSTTKRVGAARNVNSFFQEKVSFSGELCYYIRVIAV
ncbi:hypothetical protein FC07_GL001263 [Loigolactobacillus bifermentans DSM 20003]|uniref:Uncharacterized protein n=1 Tax=Loigolactobacillus bifermentans DSM 20003 TaxID=1423726 RepID=A0A0R1GHI9_9LACO|nr:hypothetical protein FC07_GL001263 [Loigolactobacillus bifermentans DSM 20003]